MTSIAVAHDQSTLAERPSDQAHPTSAPSRKGVGLVNILNRISSGLTFVA